MVLDFELCSEMGRWLLPRLLLSTVDSQYIQALEPFDFAERKSKSKRGHLNSMHSTFQVLYIVQCCSVLVRLCRGTIVLLSTTLERKFYLILRYSVLLYSVPKTGRFCPAAQDPSLCHARGSWPGASPSPVPNGQVMCLVRVLSRWAPGHCHSMKQRESYDCRSLSRLMIFPYYY